MTVPLKTAENNSKTEIIGRRGCGKNLKTASNYNKISGTNIFLEMAHAATANIRENKESNGSEREKSATPRNQKTSQGRRFTQSSKEKHTSHRAIEKN